MIDIAELAGMIEDAASPNGALDGLVDCVVYGRVVWGANPAVTIPPGEPDFWSMTAEQYEEALAYLGEVRGYSLREARTQAEEIVEDLDLYEKFGTPTTSREASPFHPHAAKFVSRLKNPNRRYAAAYTASMDAALKLLRPDQDWRRYESYCGQVVMKIVGPCSDGYPCIGRGCTPAAGLTVARLRQLAAEKVSQSA